MLSAGTDPTYIPGLDTVASAKPDTDDDTVDERPTEPAADTDADTEPDRDGADRDEDARTAVDAESAEADTDDEEAADDDKERSEEPPEGPAFEASDRRSSVVANGHGVVFRLDDAEARFDWAEIGSVEIGTSRFGRRLNVCVCTTGHRRFDAEVEADSRRQAKEWADALDSVLDSWFEDEAKDEDETEDEAGSGSAGKGEDASTSEDKSEDKDASTGKEKGTGKDKGKDDADTE